MRTRLTDIQSPEALADWAQYARLKLPYVFSPTQASYKLESGKVIGQCARKVYYEQLKLTRDDLTQRAYSIFNFGYSFEDYQIEKFKIAGIYVADHVPISFYDTRRGIYINGEVDAIVKLDSELVGVEFKTSYGYRFLHNQILGYKREPSVKREYLLDQTYPAPKPEHLLQVMCYLYYFAYMSQPPVPKITEWRIVYQDRGTCALAEYAVSLQDIAGIHIPAVYLLTESLEEQVPLVQITVEGILDRFKYIYDKLSVSKVPDRDFDPYSEEDEDWQCRYCLFNTHCKEEV